jgi:hypothetical protein
LPTLYLAQPITSNKVTDDYFSLCFEESFFQEQDVTPDSQEQDVTPDSQEQDVTSDSQEQDVTPDSQEQDVTPDSQEQDVTPDSQEQDVTPDSRELDGRSRTPSRIIPSIRNISSPNEKYNKHISK